MKYLIWLFAAASTAAHAANVDLRSIPDLPVNTVPPASVATPAPEGWKLSFGGGISYAPRYEGAAGYRWRFMPLFEASKGKWFISPFRGIGYNFSDIKERQYGLRLAVGPERKQNVDPHLDGMGTINYIPEIGVYFNQRAGYVMFSSGATTGRHGTHYEFGIGSMLPLSSADRLRFGLSSNWGDAQYNQTYFGVSPAQATATGNRLSVYTPGAGLKDYAFNLTWMHTFSTEWYSSAGLSQKWLGPAAAHSPLTQRRAASSANLLLGYRF